MENDILCLTESQVTNDTDGADIFSQLSTLKVYLNFCGARRPYFAFCRGMKHFLEYLLLILGKIIFHMT